MALSPSARAAARGGAATARRADERRRGMMSPMTSVAARGVDVGAVPAGSVGDVLPSRRVRARQRERATISDRRCGLAAASYDTQPRRHQRGRAAGSGRPAGGGVAGTAAVAGDTRRRCCRGCCRGAGRWRGEQ